MSSSLLLDKWNTAHSENILSRVPDQSYPLLKSISPHCMFSMDFLRKDWTRHSTYIIDPSGCQDADDGFSIWEDPSGVHLIVHIADPTVWFTPRITTDVIFQSILQNGITYYLSRMKPRYMIGRKILNASRLNINGPQRVISVHSILHPETYSVISSCIEFGWIQTTPEQRMTYHEASAQLVSDPMIALGVDIARIFRKQRIATSPELQALAEISIANPVVTREGMVVLEVDTNDVKTVKSMISEFAIHFNQVFAREIEGGGGAGETFRRAILTATSSTESTTPTTLSASPHTSTISSIPDISSLSSTPQEVIVNIIRAGKSAAYTTEKLPHDLVNSEAYTHATSPLRRAFDCIAHFLIKCSRLSLPRPFTDLQLRTWCDDLTKKQKLSKNLGFADKKFRYFQYIAQILDSYSPLPIITYKIISYRNGFVNIHIQNINDFQVHISYSLRRRYTQFPEHLLPMDIPRSLPISRINIPSKFDEGTLPDLDLIFPPV